MRQIPKPINNTDLNSDTSIMKSIDLLKLLVEQNSFTTNKEGVNKIGEIISKELSFMDLERHKSDQIGDYLIFHSKELDPEKPRLLFSGHADTVHLPEDDFSIKFDGEKMYGPGTQDMKGCLVVVIQLLKKLHKEGKLKNISFAITPDEETQSTTYEDITLNLCKKYDYAFIFEPTLSVPGIKKFDKSKRSIVIGRKGQGRYKIRIKAPGGHSGVLSDKEDRSSAIQEAAHMILRIEELSDYRRGTTLNIGLVKGGTSFNVLANECYLEGDYRVISIEEHERLQKALPELCAESYAKGIESSFEFMSLNPPMIPTEKTKDIAQKLVEVGVEMGVEIVEEYRGGASDGNKMSTVGLTIIDGMGIQGDGEHSKDEFVYLDSIQTSIDYAYEVMTKLF